MTVLEVKGVEKLYPTRRNLFGRAISFVRALKGVSLRVGKGETVGIIGESGCGKSTLAKVILDLEKPERGDVLFRGKSIFEMEPADYRAYRRSVQAVFQNPQSSLNPRMRIWETVTEGLKINYRTSKKELRERAEELLSTVGLPPSYLDRYPHQLSGGQKQRVAIARAVSLKPELIVADEPTSALDVSIQAQIVNLLLDLQERFGISYIFISHSLPVVESVSDYVIVMYRGMVVEEGRTESIFPSPLHPYTKLLISCVPVPDVRGRRKVLKIPLEADEEVDGCPFYGRCPLREERCRTEVPKLREVEDRHRVACFKI